MAKTYLVVAAQEEELLGLFAGLPFKKVTMGLLDSYYLSANGNSVYGILGGIGKAAIAYRLGLFLNDIKVDLILNTGVAGTLSPTLLPPLSTLVATRSAYHDVDVTAMGYAYGQMAKEPLYFDCDPEAVRMAMSLKSNDIHEGLIVSGDTFMTAEKINTTIYENFDNPLAVDMESAAVGQVAHDARIPYLVIRTISDDSTSEQNKAQYDELLKEASKRAGSIVYYLVTGKKRE
jgi:adenosylhomocysteine nucleosidase